MTDRPDFSSDDLIKQARQDARSVEGIEHDAPEQDVDSPRSRPSAPPSSHTAETDVPATSDPSSADDPYYDPSPFGFEPEPAATRPEPSAYPSPRRPADAASPVTTSGRRVGLTLVVAALVVGIGAAILAGSVLEGSATDEGPVAVGSCFNDPGGAVVSDIAQVDCAESHDFEMIGSVKIQSEEYPGEDEIWSVAIAECTGLFEGYVEAPYATSIWYLHAFTPTLEGWERGDRVANCLVFQLNPDDTILPVTGSARGDGR